jgi:hypothetical protein
MRLFWNLMLFYEALVGKITEFTTLLLGNILPFSGLM